MNREDIINLVRQAANEEMEIAVLSITELEKYTALVEAAEREACAKIVESNANACSSDSLAKMYLYSNATAIRKRGQT
jgi:hypothetical protein